LRTPIKPNRSIAGVGYAAKKALRPVTYDQAFNTGNLILTAIPVAQQLFQHSKEEKEIRTKHQENDGPGGRKVEEEGYERQRPRVNEDNIQARAHKQDNDYHLGHSALSTELETVQLPYTRLLHLVEVVGGKEKAYLAEIRIISKHPLTYLFVLLKATRGKVKPLVIVVNTLSEEVDMEDIELGEPLLGEKDTAEFSA
jgi:hypothetical protein